MRITATFNESEVKKTIRHWARLADKNVSEGVEQMARSTARTLAHTVQPYGLSDAVGRKFIKSIELQVRQVGVGVNVGIYPATKSIKEAHTQQRRYGSVRARSLRNGQRYRPIISDIDIDYHADDQGGKAGRAKAAWITAGNRVGKTRISGIRPWIRRHVGSGYGKAKQIGKGIKATFELHNKTPYISYVQKHKDVRTALMRGRRNGLRSIQRSINAIYKKQNQR